MKLQHMSHLKGEWFDVVDTDADHDFETGKYLGRSDRVKLSDGNWYLERECFYKGKDGAVKSCV